jgi:xanthine dehydrogenase YagS FAD-binding subunit
MTPFEYSRATSAADALRLAGQDGAMLLGGGTNLVDLMRKGVERPRRLVDVTGISAFIEETPGGGLSIGGAARNSAVAGHPLVRARYPMLSRAILASASAQIRNMATVGGNLMQRTRCAYFTDVAGSRCNKRDPGAGCDAVGGFTRYHAILGASASCVATHPSDMCVALVALDAQVKVFGARGGRTIPIVEFYRAPDDRPDIETVLEPGDTIVAIELPPSSVANRSAYRKVRDRASYAFALISVAAGLSLRDGKIDDVRIALGGVASRPWRAFKAEATLRGQAPAAEAFAAAAEAELADAAPLPGNAFKIGLTKRTLAAVLTELSGDDR